jgi:hypothetical protein
VKLLIPHQHGRVLNDVYVHGSVVSQSNTFDGSLVEVNLHAKWQNMYQRFIYRAE